MKLHKNPTIKGFVQDVHFLRELSMVIFSRARFT